MDIYTGPNIFLHRGNESQCQIQSLQQSKNWKTIFQTSVSWKQDGLGIPISSNTDCLPKVIKKIYKRTLYTHQRKNLPWNTFNCELICFESNSTHIYERKFTRTESMHWTSHINCGWLQHLSLLNGQIRETNFSETL